MLAIQKGAIPIIGSRQVLVYTLLYIVGPNRVSHTLQASSSIAAAVQQYKYTHVETSVSNKGEKWTEAFVLGRGLRPGWAEAGLRLRWAEVPERSALLSDKILCRRLQTEGR